MPAKLQIEESFAFLFTVIDVSGIKLDFKQIGEVAGLTVAAARMRYSRLRKAVQSGAFHGAYIHQPQGASIDMLELVNAGGRSNSSPFKGLKNLKEDDGISDDEDKKNIAVVTTRRSTRKRKVEHISDTEQPKSFFIQSVDSPKHVHTKEEKSKDKKDDPESPVEIEEVDDDYVEVKRRRRSSKPRTTCRKITLKIRDTDQTVPPPSNQTESVASKGTTAPVPPSSLFTFPVSNTVNEGKVVGSDGAEGKNRTRREQAALKGTEPAQPVNSPVPATASQQTKFNISPRMLEFHKDTIFLSDFKSNYEANNDSSQNEKPEHSFSQRPHKRPTLPALSELFLNPATPPKGLFSPPRVERTVKSNHSHNKERERKVDTGKKSNVVPSSPTPGFYQLPYPVGPSGTYQSPYLAGSSCQKQIPDVALPVIQSSPAILLPPPIDRRYTGSNTHSPIIAFSRPYSSPYNSSSHSPGPLYTFSPSTHPRIAEINTNANTLKAPPTTRAHKVNSYLYSPSPSFTSKLPPLLPKPYGPQFHQPQAPASEKLAKSIPKSRTWFPRSDYKSVQTTPQVPANISNTSGTVIPFIEPVEPQVQIASSSEPPQPPNKDDNDEKPEPVHEETDPEVVKAAAILLKMRHSQDQNGTES